MINTAEDKRKLVERAVLIGIRPHDQDPAVAAEHLAELKELVANLDIPVVGEIVVPLRTPQAEYFTGSGKAEELGLGTDLNEIGSVIKEKIAELNRSLPSFKQVRGLEMRRTEFEKNTSKKIIRYKIK